MSLAHVEKGDFATVLALTLPDATPLPQNAYKLPMARNIIMRALSRLLPIE